jgi:hypothetical protein
MFNPSSSQITCLWFIARSSQSWLRGELKEGLTFSCVEDVYGEPVLTPDGKVGYCSYGTVY